jgi:hypothetical protein
VSDLYAHAPWNKNPVGCLVGARPPPAPPPGRRAVPGLQIVQTAGPVDRGPWRPVACGLSFGSVMPFVRNTCESCLSFDIRVMHRQNKLWPTGPFIQSWMSNGEEVGGVSVRCERDRVFLSYRRQDITTETFKDVLQSVNVVRTSCPFGGHRSWFLCPTRGCGRVAILYFGRSGVFACRACHRLAYATQFESLGYRGIERARRIRMKLGGGPNLFDRFPHRPKGMHRRTYLRLEAAYKAAARRCGATEVLRRRSLQIAKTWSCSDP